MSDPRFDTYEQNDFFKLPRWEKVKELLDSDTFKVSDDIFNLFSNFFDHQILIYDKVDAIDCVSKYQPCYR